MKSWMVVNIGCIECGVTSNIVGVFHNQQQAEDVLKACQKSYAWRQGGQNEFKIFELPEIGIIHPEYELPDTRGE